MASLVYDNANKMFNISNKIELGVKILIQIYTLKP